MTLVLKYVQNFIKIHKTLAAWVHQHMDAPFARIYFISSKNK